MFSRRRRRVQIDRIPIVVVVGRRRGAEEAPEIAAEVLQSDDVTILQVADETTPQNDDVITPRRDIVVIVTILMTGDAIIPTDRRTDAADLPLVVIGTRGGVAAIFPVREMKGLLSLFSEVCRLRNFSRRTILTV